MEYDVEDKLKNIKAKALIVSSKNDMYYSPNFDVMPIEDLIENSKIILLEPSANYSTYEDYPMIEDELNNFLDSVKK